jgi:hypothetical protein
MSSSIERSDVTLAIGILPFAVVQASRACPHAPRQSLLLVRPDLDSLHALLRSLLKKRMVAFKLMMWITEQSIGLEARQTALGPSQHTAVCPGWLDPARVGENLTHIVMDLSSVPAEEWISGREGGCCLPSSSCDEGELSTDPKILALDSSTHRHVVRHPLHASLTIGRLLPPAPLVLPNSFCLIVSILFCFEIIIRQPLHSRRNHVEGILGIQPWV